MKIPKPSWKKQQLKKKRLRKEADNLWKIAIINKWGKLCVCGEESGPPHHFYPKGLYGHLRYDLDNGVPICIGGHFAHHHKGDPQIHQAIIDYRGKYWLNRLKKKVLDKPKPGYKTIKYYQDIIEKLKQK